MRDEYDDSTRFIITGAHGTVSATIDDVLCIEQVKALLRLLVAAGFHHNSVVEAVIEIADEYKEYENEV